MDVAMRYLAPSAHSCSEVRKLLLGEGYGAAAAEAAVDRLAELGILDDAAFARNWVERVVVEHHEAPAKAQAALISRGIDPRLVEAALEEVAAEDATFARAMSLGETRLRVLRGAEPAVRRKLAGFLARRGYDPETVHEVVTRLLPLGWSEEGNSNAEAPRLSVR
jgi:regulatory protein